MKSCTTLWMCITKVISNLENPAVSCTVFSDSRNCFKDAVWRGIKWLHITQMGTSAEMKSSPWIRDRKLTRKRYWFFMKTTKSRKTVSWFSLSAAPFHVIRPEEAVCSLSENVLQSVCLSLLAPIWWFCFWNTLQMCISICKRQPVRLFSEIAVSRSLQLIPPSACPDLIPPLPLPPHPTPS